MDLEHISLVPDSDNKHGYWRPSVAVLTGSVTLASHKLPDRHYTARRRRWAENWQYDGAGQDTGVLLYDKGCIS